MSVFFLWYSAQTEMREPKRRLSVDCTRTTVKQIHGPNLSMNLDVFVNLNGDKWN